MKKTKTPPEANPGPKTRNPCNKVSDDASKVSEKTALDASNVKSEQKKVENRGRPTIRTTELTDTIISRMTEGESLRSISRDPIMPPAGTILRWVSECSVFREQYENAMAQRAEAMFEEILDIADETSQDTIETENGERANTEWISRSRLRVDARKWMLSKMLPKKYGERMQLAGDPLQPLQVESNLNVSSLSTQALAEIMAAADAAKSK